MGQSQATPTAVEVCAAFLKVMDQRVNLEQDPVLSSDSMHGDITKVKCFMGAGSPVLRFSHLFSTEAEYREIATEVMSQLGCKPKDIKGTLKRNQLEELHAVLKHAR